MGSCSAPAALRAPCLWKGFPAPAEPRFGLFAVLCSGLFSQPVSTWTLAEFSCLAPVLGSLLRQPCSVLTKCSHWAFAAHPLPFVLPQVSFAHKECLRPVWSGRAPSWGFGGYSGLGWLIRRCRSKLYLELCTIIIYIIIIYLEIIKG